LATSPTEKPLVDIAIRLFGLFTALLLVYGFATLCDHVLTRGQAGHRIAQDTVSAADFVKAHHNDADSVVDTVRAVQERKTMVASCDSDIATRASFQQTLSDAKDEFDAVNNKLVSSAATMRAESTANPPTLESAYIEMETAVAQLSDAVSTASSFVDSQKPSDLANYRTQWTQGSQHWNKAVTKIWDEAGQRQRRRQSTNLMP
jgi:hypothetical protein